MYKKRIITVAGTRPEAIKMAPVILGLKQCSWADVRVLVTAQHREILDQALGIFGIMPDIDLDIMQHGQTLANLTSQLLLALDKVLDEVSPDMVLAQGDTTTVMATSLICFYNKIPFAHIEAGLRTGNITSPFPEEMNRTFVGKLSALHFAPTEQSCRNLIEERVAADIIFETGNTVIDALLMTAERNDALDIELDSSKRLVLMTSHRRENFGEPMRESFTAIRTLVEKNDDIQLLYPVHPNPSVLKVVAEVFTGHPRIILTKPMAYVDFVQAMKRAYLIITDSGGMQEEAPALGKPVLVLRNRTERPEAVDAGVVRLVGTDGKRIITEAEKLLHSDDEYAKMAKGVSPYGDGKAAERIIAILKDHLL